jgi:hypothetical protein
MDVYTNVFNEGDAICMSTFTHVDINTKDFENLFVIGDIFMQKYYTIFDRDNGKVGFATAKNFAPEEHFPFEVDPNANLRYGV